PEAAIEVLGAIVEVGAAIVGADLQRLLRPARGGDVVDQLVVALVADDRERARVAENREREAGAAGHADDRSARIVGDRPRYFACADTDARFLNRVGGEDVGPRQSEARLVIHLTGFFTD